ncbi:unnamed protein product [Parascedosporium putredinis]|uniref:DUF7702 domain-containing protein n=1 Tax=Parascedosporium putredinis TaxID=1442378 RepID=A0A9P1H7Z8_9PEZI|nr:unnamed protein product [Parascedosporium putredinis]CAI8001759.1 unnamed protein product [Parascedosporium putredinis]
MGNFNYHDAVAVAQIIFFVISLACGILLCTRHGWNKSSGFLILVTFSIIRIVGASFRLATISNPSRSNYVGALICESIGVSTLVILNIGMLTRLNRCLPVRHQIGKKMFSVISLVSIIAVGLSIKGGSDMAKQLGNAAPNSFSKAAVVLFTLVYVGAVAIFALLLQELQVVPLGEKRLLACFAACLPFIVVRLIYALLANFSHGREFSSINGNPTIWLCMSVVMEFIVVTIVIGISLTLKKLEKPTKASEPTYT